MNLLDDAAATVRGILGDDANGFGRSVTLMDPLGQAATVIGKPTDISELIDPETGVLVSGRHVSIAFSLATLDAAGLGWPKATQKGDSRPWRVLLNDTTGRPHSLSVRETKPDRIAGVLVCILEAYSSGTREDPVPG